MKMFRNALVYVHNKGIIRTNLVFDKTILSVESEEPLAEEIKLKPSYIVVPGFIDSHIHGAGGADAMDATPLSLTTLSQTLLSEGTTSFLATTMTAEKEKLTKALKNVNEFMKKESEGARLLGVHLEGPFINEKYAGAQPHHLITKPNIELFDELNSCSGNNIKIVTLAPEVEGAEKLIAHLTKNNVVCSIGHSNAKYEDVTRAVKLGASSVTHTFNAQSPLHHREIGVVGSALLMNKLKTEIIADGLHISPAALQLLIKCKNKDDVILITDAMRAKGLNDGESELGGQKVIVCNGSARLVDGTLAGSVLKMNDAIKLLHFTLGVPLENAIDFASINAATRLSLDKEMGSIEKGKIADLTVLDKDLNVVMVFVNGKLKYSRE